MKVKNMLLNIKYINYEQNSTLSREIINYITVANLIKKYRNQSY